VTLEIYLHPINGDLHSTILLILYFHLNASYHDVMNGHDQYPNSETTLTMKCFEPLSNRLLNSADSSLAVVSADSFHRTSRCSLRVRMDGLMMSDIGGPSTVGKDHGGKSREYGIISN